MFQGFCLSSKIKIEIIVAKHQKCFLIVWLELKSIWISWKIFEDFIQSFQGVLKILLLLYWDFIQSFQGVLKILLLLYWDKQKRSL